MPTDEPRRPSARAMALVDDDECASVDMLHAEMASEHEILAPHAREMARLALDGALTKWRQSRAALLAYVADLEAARDFYADPAHYGTFAELQSSETGRYCRASVTLSAVERDGGARARAVPQ